MTIMTIGGFTASEIRSLHGCIAKLELNGTLIDLQTSTKVMRYSAGPCPSKTRKGAHFRGDAYATYERNFEFAENVRVAMNLKSNAKDAVLLSFTSHSERPSFSLEIFNGQLVAAVDAGTPRFPILLRANTSLNCKRDWHPVQASFSLHQVWVQVDDERPVVAAAPDGVPDIASARSNGPLYIGGLPYTAERGVLLAHKNLVGCISNMTISGEPVSWDSIREIRNVRHHMCPDF